MRMACVAARRTGSDLEPAPVGGQDLLGEPRVRAGNGAREHQCANQLAERAERLAIEQALVDRGLMSRMAAGWRQVNASGSIPINCGVSHRGVDEPLPASSSEPVRDEPAERQLEAALGEGA